MGILYTADVRVEHFYFLKSTNIMLAEQFEQLVALIQGQRALSYPGWSIDLAAVTKPVLALLALALIIDYGYMLYLHFQMASPHLKSIPIMHGMEC